MNDAVCALFSPWLSIITRRSKILQMAGSREVQRDGRVGLVEYLNKMRIEIRKLFVSQFDFT